MASNKKPSINLGPIDDWAAKALKKALMGMKGAAKKQQAAKIISKMESKARPASQQAKRVYEIKKSASKASGQFARSRTKRRQMEAITKDASAHYKKMKSAGKKWDGSVDLRLKKMAEANKRAAAKTKAENAALAKAYEKKMAGPPKKVASQMKRINKIDVEANRGTGSVYKRGGKKVAVPKARAAEARRRAGAMSSQLKKSNTKELNDLARLEADVRKATTPEQRLAARRALRQFRADTGR